MKLCKVGENTYIHLSKPVEKKVKVFKFGLVTQKIDGTVVQWVVRRDEGQKGRIWGTSPKIWVMLYKSRQNNRNNGKSTKKR